MKAQVCEINAGSSPWRGERFFSESSSSALDSLTVSVQPLCAIACINICAQLKKIPSTGTIPLFGHRKILQTLTGMGSAALATAVSYPGKATRIST